MAYVTVKLGAGDSLQLLEYRGYSHSSAENSRNLFSSPLSGAMRDDEGQVLMSPSGEVMQCTATYEIPLLMAPQAQMVIEKLPNGNEQEWETRRVTALSLSDPSESRGGPDSFARVGSRYFPRYPGAYPPRERTVIMIPATEQIKYRITKQTDETIEIEKTTDLTTIEREGESSRLKIVGDGTLVWDKKLGVPKSLKQSMTLALYVSGERLTLPLELEYSLKDALTKAEQDAALAAELAKQARERDSATPAASLSSVTPPLSVASQLDDLVVVLKSKNPSVGDLTSALVLLGKLEPVESRRTEVAALIEPCLKQSRGIQGFALTALEKWGTPANAAAILELLQSGDKTWRPSAIRVLGATGGNAESAAYLAKYLPVTGELPIIAPALKQMGTHAEQPVWEFLGYGNFSTHNSACQILAAVGTERSLAKLKALPAEKEEYRRKPVEDAIRAIEARIGNN